MFVAVSGTCFVTTARTEMATEVAEGTRKARKSRGERGWERKTPIGGKATLTLRRGHGVSYLEGLAVTTRDSTCSGVFSLLLPVS